VRAALVERSLPRRLAGRVAPRWGAGAGEGCDAESWLPEAGGSSSAGAAQVEAKSKPRSELFALPEFVAEAAPLQRYSEGMPFADKTFFPFSRWQWRVGCNSPAPWSALLVPSSFH
jgi:hypothetical protein